VAISIHLTKAYLYQGYHNRLDYKRLWYEFKIFTAKQQPLN